ncbi:hypothetical protein Pfo_003736 [Paulownia fortunei]|nr:hypothetical protein Pfo_003736 [Paulownia fortunei]
MGIRFVLMVNKQGQTRLAQYYECLNLEEGGALEGEIVRKCSPAQNNSMLDYTCRKVSSILVLVLFRSELAIFEFIHLLVESMDRHFSYQRKYELDIMFHLEKAHLMFEEMVMNGCIVETSKSSILSPIQLMETAS